MTGTALYNLSWGEYGTSLVNAVQLLRCHGELVDVTLAAGGKTFHAHKVVLCAASPFLLDILKSTTCKHPVVLLAGVQASDLEALLEFVYRGEVSIDPNQLPSLLQAAHCLNIQGLTPSGHLAGELAAHHTHLANMEQQKGNELNQLNMSTESRSSSHSDELPVKRRKRAKRLTRNELTSPLSKWSKVYVQVDAAEHLLAASSSHDSSTQPWNPHMNLVNLTSPTTVDALPLQSPILVQNIPSIPNPSANTGTTTGPKIRGASDQPGACPLCGAMLRQARNLRRHLLTSCKYRMITGSGSSGATAAATATASTTSTHIEPPKATTVAVTAPPPQAHHHDTQQFHELQTMAVQGLDHVHRSGSSAEKEAAALTQMGCRDLIQGNNMMSEFK